MIKAIIFDCFGVLYIPVGEDFYAAHVPEYEKHKQELHDLWHAADRGELSHPEVVRRVVQLTGLDADTVQKGIDGGLAKNQALLDFSKRLRPICKIGLLTNMGPGVMDNYFTQAERNHFFNAVVVSSEEGMVKPNKDIYLLAARRLGVSPDECLLIDDSQVNCAGAESVGMRAILYESTAQVVDVINKQLGR